MPFLAKIKRIKEYLLYESLIHPEAQLLDYYKYFSQSAFGPGHIITDYQTAKENLMNEVQHTENFDQIMIQKCNYFKAFYRVNLKLIKENHIDFDVFFNAFIESASVIESLSEIEFIDEWNIVINVIKMELPNLLNSNDIELINQMIEKKKYLCHHSDRFKELYHPHYRLIHHDFLTSTLKDIFDKEEENFKSMHNLL